MSMEHALQLGPMLVLAALMTGLVSESVWRFGSFGLNWLRWRASPRWRHVLAPHLLSVRRGWDARRRLRGRSPGDHRAADRVEIYTIAALTTGFGAAQQRKGSVPDIVRNARAPRTVVVGCGCLPPRPSALALAGR